MRVKENLNVVKIEGDRSIIYCQEDYAQELYDIMFKNDRRKTVIKDTKVGDIMRITEFKSHKDGTIEAICDNYDSIFIDIKKERKFIEMLGMTEDSFKEWIQSSKSIDNLSTNKMTISLESPASRKGSLYNAHLKTITREFMEQIAKPTTAYIAKIIDKNQGGFIVEVQGVKAFLPGSLAAANKIVNFDDYIGKEIHVMLEDYLSASDIFVVSYKKYLEYILPSKLSALSKNQIMIGTITGTSKFGIFAEFDEIFTGLLHSSEMSPDTQEKFATGKFKPGQKIETWLKDVKDGKLILTENDPQVRESEMEIYKERTEGIIKTATIVSMKSFGILMEIEKDKLGLLPIKESKKIREKLSVGDKINVCVTKVDTSTGKIYLSLIEQKVVSKA